MALGDAPRSSGVGVCRGRLRDWRTGAPWRTSQARALADEPNLAPSILLPLPGRADEPPVLPAPVIQGLCRQRPDGSRARGRPAHSGVVTAERPHGGLSLGGRGSRGSFLSFTEDKKPSLACRARQRIGSLASAFPGVLELSSRGRGRSRCRRSAFRLANVGVAVGRTRGRPCRDGAGAMAV